MVGHSSSFRNTIFGVLYCSTAAVPGSSFPCYYQYVVCHRTGLREGPTGVRCWSAGFGDTHGGYTSYFFSFRAAGVGWASVFGFAVLALSVFKVLSKPREPRRKGGRGSSARASFVILLFLLKLVCYFTIFFKIGVLVYYFC